MDTRYIEDGDPYGPAERKRPLMRPWVWVAGGVALLALLVTQGMSWMKKDSGNVPMVTDQASLVIPTQKWDNYQSLKPDVKPISFERDTRVDALQRDVQALRMENGKLSDQLRELQQRKAPEPAPTKADTPAKTKRMHRDMGVLVFPQEKEAAEQETLYVLSPGDAKLTCTVESAMNSSVESVATVKISSNTYDTRTRRHLLVPQGSTILARYASKDLLYGSQRLPVNSALLTLPNGKTLELDKEPIMDPIGQAGLVTDVDSRFWTALPAVLIQGVLRGTQASVSSIGGPFVGGLAGSATQFGTRVTQPFADLRPIITVSAGEECVVILTKALHLPAYRER